MGNFIGTVKNGIQNAILVFEDNTITSKIEVAAKSMNSTTGRFVVIVKVYSDYEEQLRVTNPFENASERIAIFRNGF